MKKGCAIVISILVMGLVFWESYCESKEQSNPASGPSMTISSPAFSSGADIPAVYSCTGANDSPALNWSNAPQGTQTFAIIMEDPDAPLGAFTHWIIFNIPADQTSLSEKASPNGRLPAGAIEGLNDFGKIGYGGPCPPAGKAHRYYFNIYALDSALPLNAGVTKTMLLQSMKGRILAQAQLMGKFAK